MEQFRRTAKLNGGNGCFAPKSAGGETIQASEDHVRFSGMMAKPLRAARPDAPERKA
jgi:hypothetical protein